jgi:hypothetical protein
MAFDPQVDTRDINTLGRMLVDGRAPKADASQWFAITAETSATADGGK